MGLKGSDPGLGFGRSSQLKTQHPLSARSRYLMAPWRNNFLKSFLSPLLGLYFHSVDLALPQETTERKETGSIIQNLPAPLLQVRLQACHFLSYLQHALPHPQWDHSCQVPTQI